ncbi:hypothetical protein [Burkholderia sp. Bp8990]|uniref:hypothetical protein n=1 Tax=Burkholderia sp. Bp8990 TaxID=2184552 RepID=UPI000F59E05D|nr:hypothetical protein [Burkholderia sp. Bp8990]
MDRSDGALYIWIAKRWKFPSDFNIKGREEVRENMKGLSTSVMWSTGLGGLLGIFFFGAFSISNLCNAHELMNKDIGNSYQWQIGSGALMMSERLANNVFLGGAAPGMGGLTSTGGYPIQGGSVTPENSIGGSDGGSASLPFGNERNDRVGTSYLSTLDRSPNNQTAYSTFPSQGQPYAPLHGKSSPTKLKRLCVNSSFNRPACQFP